MYNAGQYNAFSYLSSPLYHELADSLASSDTRICDVAVIKTDGATGTDALSSVFDALRTFVEIIQQTDAVAKNPEKIHNDSLRFATWLQSKRVRPENWGDA